LIICTTQPIEKYSCDHESGFRLGIGRMIETHPALFSLASLMSPILYQWEDGTPVPEDCRCHSFEPYLYELYTKTLSASVGGVSVSQWLSLLETPTEFYLNLSQFSLTGLPLLDFYDSDQLRLVMRARCYSWIKSQNSSNLNQLLTLFTESDEKEVKSNAYGRFNVA